MKPTCANTCVLVECPRFDGFIREMHVAYHLSKDGRKSYTYAECEIKDNFETCNRCRHAVALMLTLKNPQPQDPPLRPNL